MHEHVLAEMEAPAHALLKGYRLCSGGFITKQPGKEQGVVELHQDPTMVDDTRFIALGIWCPLVDVDLRNGCLRVVPGSHRINRRPREAMVIDFPYTDLLSCIEDKYLADIPMKAGQAFVYTQTLFHSSLPNYSDRERLVAGALAIPDGSRLQVYLRDKERHPELLAGYEVSADFYRTYCLGSVPEDSLRIGFVDDNCEPMSEERLRDILGRRLDP
jgi:ectoine hydroxylase-related dioxygenase (phytanoyl-CoA dioxygenase family)